MNKLLLTDVDNRLVIEYYHFNGENGFNTEHIISIPLDQNKDEILAKANEIAETVIRLEPLSGFSRAMVLEHNAMYDIRELANPSFKNASPFTYPV